IALLTAILSAGQFLLTGLNRHRNAAVVEIANGVLALVFVTLTLRWLGLNAVGLGVVTAAALTSVGVVFRGICGLLGAGSLPSLSFLLRIVSVATASSVAASVALRVGEKVGEVSVVFRLIVAGAVGLAVYGTLALAVDLVLKDEAIAVGRRLR